jgi:hypothetical protein
MKISRRIAAIATVIAVLVSPVVATSASASVPQITGTTGGYADTWIDTSIGSEFTVGVPYSDTVQAPACCTGYGGMLTDLPSWMEASLDSNGTVTFSGTPTTAGDDIYIEVEFGGSDGTYFWIEFYIDVVPDTTPTVTTVATDSYSPYTAVNLSATVNAPSGGSVAFYLDDTLVGTVALAAVGTAEYTGAVPASFVGSSPVVTAVYSGDATHAASTSTSDPTVYIYGDRTISGTVMRNGEPQVGTLVTLLTSSFNSTGLTDTTDATGAYSFTLAPPTTLAEATAGYAVQSGTGLYYSTAGGWKQTNVTSLASATVVYESDWSDLTIYLNIYPTWTDQALHQPRMGESYSDSVVATTEGTPSTITYSIRSGTLPSWLSFSNGTFTSTGPTDQLSHTFEVQADSAFGLIYKEFTLQAGDAGVTPTFTDTTIADLQVGTAVVDGVAATGDPTIVYTSTALPDGLVLNSATGEITGSPTTAGEYSVTFTATNDFGSDEYIWEPTIAAAPELDLVLNFAAGTTIDSASTEISAGGLKVGSTYTLYLHSTPVLLYSGTIDPSGAFTQVVSLPADTPVGAHELILTGIAPDGTVMTAHAWFTLLPNGTIGAISYAGPLSFRLALTGSEPLLPLGIASALMLAGFIALRRRSQQA